MASTTKRGMGQLRYDKTSNYLTEVKFKAGGYKSAGITASKSYRDILLRPSENDSFSFKKGVSYYLHIGIPQNTTYDMELDLKLVRYDTAATTIDTDEYQEIKKIVVPRVSGDNIDYTRVIIYPDVYGENTDTDIDTAETILAAAQEDESSVSAGGVWYSGSNDEDKYQLKLNDSWVEITNYNAIILKHTWKQSTADNIIYYDIVFSPKVELTSGFNSVLLELKRTNIDDDIQFTIDNTSYYGVHIDESLINADGNLAMYTINNLVDNSSYITQASVTNIGVWGHPNLIMTINGEEIRIGQSGYYELNDFEITNLGVVAQGIEDKFTIDYQYEIS